MGRKQLIEELEQIVSGNHPEVESKIEEGWDDLDLTEDEDADWGPATSVLWIGAILEQLAEAVGEEEAELWVQNWINEAWSYAISPEEKDVTPDIGTIDEPSHADVKRGFRGRASGLTPTGAEGMRVILNILSKKPPKPIGEFPVEVAAEVWQDALGKALNKGIGVKWEMDKPTGIQYPMPDYQVIYGIWKGMMEKLVGVRPSRENDVKMMHSLDKAAAIAAKDLRQGMDKLGAKRSAQASAILRGRKGRSDLK